MRHRGGLIAPDPTHCLIRKPPTRSLYRPSHKDRKSSGGWLWALRDSSDESAALPWRWGSEPRGSRVESPRRIVHRTRRRRAGRPHRAPGMLLARLRGRHPDPPRPARTAGCRRWPQPPMVARSRVVRVSPPRSASRRRPSRMRFGARSSPSTCQLRRPPRQPNRYHSERRMPRPRLRRHPSWRRHPFWRRHPSWRRHRRARGPLSL